MALKSSFLIALLLLLLLLVSLYSSSPDSLMVSSYTHRKLLATTTLQHQKNTQLFDFTPFKRRHRNRGPTRPEPGGEHLDPLYGPEKRLVPTGPNPLHH